jgi:hypothetical protein
MIADCLATEMFQEGEAVLREEEPLTSDAKFYIVDQGHVECFKTFNVRPRHTLIVVVNSRSSTQERWGVHMLWALVAM